MSLNSKIKCEICGKKYDNIRSLACHMKFHNITCKSYYDKYTKLDGEGICNICGKKTTFNSMTFGYKKHCSSKCAGADLDTIKQRENTCINKYNYTHVSKIPTVRDKMFKSRALTISKLPPKILKPIIISDTGNMKCEICGRKLNGFKGLSAHIRQFHKIKSKEYYDKYIKIGKEGICKECGTNTRFVSLSAGYNPFCSDKCSNANLEVRDKIIKSNIKSTGYSNPMKSKIIRDEICARCKEKTGYNYLFKNPNFKKELIKFNQNKYGVDYHTQSDNFKNKTNQTNIKKYGFVSPMQNAEIQLKSSKNAFRTKEYKFPSGRIDNVQGYEPQALNILLEQGYNEDDIETQSLQIPYIFENNNHVYHPDIYIKSENRLIEVKSDYTYSAEFEKNLAKEKACLNAGYKFEFWILTGSGVRISEEDTICDKLLWMNQQ